MAIVDSRTVLRVSTTASLPTLAAGDEGTLAYDQEADLVMKWSGSAWTSLADPSGSQGSYAPGSFTIATGKFYVMTKRLILTGSQRAVVQGTGRLRIT